MTASCPPRPPVHPGVNPPPSGFIKPHRAHGDWCSCAAVLLPALPSSPLIRGYEYYPLTHSALTAQHSLTHMLTSCCAAASTALQPSRSSCAALCQGFSQGGSNTAARRQACTATNIPGACERYDAVQQRFKRLASHWACEQYAAVPQRVKCPASLDAG